MPKDCHKNLSKNIINIKTLDQRKLLMICKSESCLKYDKIRTNNGPKIAIIAKKYFLNAK